MPQGPVTPRKVTKRNHKTRHDTELEKKSFLQKIQASAFNCTDNKLFTIGRVSKTHKGPFQLTVTGGGKISFHSGNLLSKKRNSTSRTPFILHV